jgi:hypothetical protein
MRHPSVLASALAPLLLLGAAHAASGGESTRTENKNTTRTENKTITVVNADVSADGSTTIAREKVRDCILALPDPDKVEPLVFSEAVFVQGLNGEKGRNEWIKSYSARLDVSYITRETDLLIVTTRSVNPQPPMFREVEKTLRHSESFVSNPAEGDAFGGRSDRRYYFTTAEGAVKDVKARARVWIGQQAPTVCPAK